MALGVSGMEGNEIADDFIRKYTPDGRWADAWDVFKSNFFKLVLLNVFVLITFIPAVVIMYFRGAYITGMGSVYPFNSSIIYPFYPDIIGLNESVTLSADLLFFSVLIVGGFIASIGISGAAYSIRKLLITHGEFSVKSFFHGIKVNYFSTVLPVTLFMIFLFGATIVGDWKDLAYAKGVGQAGAMTAYVFIIIATVLVGIFAAWMFAVGTGYRVKFTQLFKNSFVFIIGTPLQTVLMAGIAMIPVWLFLIGGVVRIISYVLFIFIGFSFMLLTWMAFANWAFDMYITPNVKAATEQVNSKKSEQQLAMEKAEAEKKEAMELLAAGKSELIARPIMPIGAEVAVKPLATTFTRGDVLKAQEERASLSDAVVSYEKAHQNDPVYAEYAKMFAEREKALPSDNKKGKKGKKISSDNLLK